MNRFLIARILFFLLGAVYAAAAAMIWRIRTDNLPGYERFCRRRIPALFIGWAVLALCVPHVQEIAPFFSGMEAVLYLIAYFGGVLAAWLVDFPMARAVAGAMILASFYAVHFAFDFHAAALPAVSVCAWLAGLFGIAVSGKPPLLRDIFRKCAERGWKKVFAVLFAAEAAAMLLAALTIRIA